MLVVSDFCSFISLSEYTHDSHRKFTSKITHQLAVCQKISELLGLNSVPGWSFGSNKKMLADSPLHTFWRRTSRPPTNRDSTSSVSSWAPRREGVLGSWGNWEGLLRVQGAFLYDVSNVYDMYLPKYPWDVKGCQVNTFIEALFGVSRTEGLVFP